MRLNPVVAVETDIANPAVIRPFHARHPILSLFALSLFLFLPILVWGFPTTGDDSEVHLRWQYFYGKQMWEGDPFPRWISDIADGFGSPAFFIYPPLSHFVAALLAPFSDDTAWIQHRLAIAGLLACFLGGVGCFVWLKRLTGERNAALIGAIVYLLAPYHLFVDTYYRAAYAELWALACAPFALAGLHLLQSRRRTGMAMIVFGTSALLMSHAPTSLILIPLYMVYACLLAMVQRRGDILVWTAIATGSAVLIAGIYLATALTQQSYIHTEALYTGYFKFYNWLIFEPNPVSKKAFNLSGVLQALMTIVLAGSLLVAKTDRKQWRWLAVATLAGTCILSFMMTSFSEPLWALVPFAQKIQFPWRLQTAQTLLLALSAALFMRAAAPSLAARLARVKVASGEWLGWLLVTLLIAMNAAMLHHAAPKFRLDPPIRTLETTEYTLGDRIGGARYFAGHDKAFVSAGTGSLAIVRWEPRHIVLQIDAATTTELLVKQFTYTGWTCRSAGAPETCRILSSKTGDILHVQVLPGTHRIELTMPVTIQERIGQCASIFGLIVAAISMVAAGRKRRHALTATGLAATAH